MNRSLAVVLAVSSMFGLAASSFAQVSVEATVIPAIESLSPDGAGGESQITLDGGLDTDLLFASERGRLTYSLDGGTYGTLGDWSFLQHDAGLTWRLGPTSGPHTFLGISGTARRNGDSWAGADYDAVGTRMNFVWAPRKGVTLRTGLRADARWFTAMPAIDQIEGVGFASFLVNLPSRTTLIGEVALGGKSYAGEAILASGEVAAALGSHTLGGNGRRAGSMAPGMPPPAAAAMTVGDDRAGQITWLVRAAQSLGQRTGLSLQLTGRSVFGSVPPLVVATPPLLFEDGVYDDSYASDASSVRVRIKHVLGGGTVGSVEGAWLAKGYGGTLALDATGAPRTDGTLREDTVWQTAASASVPILTSHTRAVSLALELGWKYTRHRSNDAFYRYDVNSVRMGLSAAY